MRWTITVITCLAALRHGAVEAQPSGRDLGAEVRGVFAAKCAGCHGPDLAKPRGRFGYVLDLRRVAENPEMVIPSRPDESELWVLVQRGEMPPADSPQGPLTGAEKETIRAWIAAGAPDASPASGASFSTTAPESPADLSVAERTIRWVGKFHLLVLHFPIALVIAAGVAEARSALRRSRVPAESVRFCLWLGATAAVSTVALGWFHAAAGNGAGSPQLLMAHRWLGTTAGLWLAATAICAEIDARRGVRSRHVRLMLAAGILLTVFAAHFGGILDHGRDFFDW